MRATSLKPQATLGLAPALACLALACLAAAPAAADEGHDHAKSSGIVLVTDLRGDGYARVGGLNHFTLLALGTGTEPQFHQDLPYRVTHNGVVVLATDADSGHDYDGVQSFGVAFHEPGPFKVEALLEDGTVAASFEGEVVPLGSASGGYDSHGAADPVALGPGTFGFAWDETEADGAPVPLDIYFDVLRSGRLVAHSKLHGAGAAAIDYPIDGAGSFSTWFEAYDGRPEPGQHVYPAVGSPFTFASPAVGLGPVQLPADTMGRAPVDANAVAVGESDGPYRIIGTYDPWTEVGPDTLLHLAVLVVDARGHPVPGVAFEAELQNALGDRIGGSSDLYEHDGILEWSTLQTRPGLYALHAQASLGAWAGRIDMPFTVSAPIDLEPGTVGQVGVAFEGPAQAEAGRSQAYSILVTDGTGGPLAHSEAFVEVIGPGFFGPAVHHAFKVHTHGDGRMDFQLAFEQAGSYDVRVHVSPLEARPVAIPAAEFKVEVLPAAQADAQPAGDGEPDDGEEAPTLGWGVTAAALLALALAARSWRRNP